MEIIKVATSGSLESGDVMITVSHGTGIEINITSPVIHQFGDQIRNVVISTLNRLSVQNIRIDVVDQGALDCTIKARIENAVFRAAGKENISIPWGDTIR